MVLCFNGALCSLRAFGIATALVITGAATSVWRVEAYVGVKDEFSAATRLTLLTKWPLLTSLINRLSDSTPLLPSLSAASASFSVMTAPIASDDPADAPPPPSPKTAVVPDDLDGWNWPAAQARLAVALRSSQRRPVGEVEAEWELECSWGVRVDPDAVSLPA
ncbi:hypothetical protein BJV74DRAFT_890516 [Russula compacta]|nr:hypothetical protein BJV74DRAFT_890516 [Russula compacta]